MMEYKFSVFGDDQMCFECARPGFMDQQSDDSKDPLNALTYLGDSFDGEIFTTEDALRLALDPLELEELQMLADSSILTDPATEDSFRLDRP